MTDKPWLTEPLSFDFEAEGLPCKMLRTDLLRHWCGYVAVGDDHPWFGLPRNALVKLPPSWFERRTFDQGVGPLDVFIHAMRDKPLEEGCEISLALHVHGGVTWADDHAPLHEADGRWWFGFDCGHFGDLMPWLMRYQEPDFMKALGLPDMPEHLSKVMGIGNDVWRDQGYVVAECQSLAKQLVDVAEVVRAATAAHQEEP